MNQSIFTESFQPPQFLELDKFVLFPTSLDYADSDYDAVMEVKGYLRAWSVSVWPKDDFTREQNREDLALHIADNFDHSAYGYMIYSKDRSRCMGSLYVIPVATVSANYDFTSGSEEDLHQFDVRVNYWLREQRADVENFFAREMRDWFLTTWKVKPLFISRPSLQLRNDTYSKVSFKKVAHLESKDDRAEMLLFSPLQT